MGVAASAEVLGGGGQECVVAGVAGEGRLVGDECESGDAGFVRPADEFEEDPHPGGVFGVVADRVRGVAQR
jgi:hypothetical protein